LKYFKIKNGTAIKTLKVYEVVCNNSGNRNQETGDRNQEIGDFLSPDSGLRSPISDLKNKGPTGNREGTKPWQAMDTTRES
jgi:hypothetical protein